MRQLEKKTRISEMRKQELIVATLNSLCRHGYLNSTINTISDESGMSRGLISHYFASKDDLLASAHRYYLQNADDFYRHLSVNATGGAFQRLYFAAAGPFLRELGYNEILIHYMSAGSMVPEIRAHHRELWGKFRAYVGRRMAAVAQEKGMTIDVRLQAYALTQLSDGLWLGLTLEDGYTADDCLVILRRHLCDLFGEKPEDHPLRPEFDMENFPTTAPLPRRTETPTG